MKEVIDGWRIPGRSLAPNSPELLCPFCSYQSQTWKERVGHVTKHYKEMDLQQIIEVLFEKRGV
jgi:hypothetical protein